MTNDSFLVELAAILEVDPGELSESFELTIDNWDSLAIVTTIVLIDEQFGVIIQGDILGECTSIGELLTAIYKVRGY